MKPRRPRRASLVAVLALAGGLTMARATPQEPPAWAYPITPPPAKTKADDPTLYHVPGSTLGFTRAQVLDRTSAVDWHPDAHPPLPAPLAHGRAPDYYACGFCHYPNGQGRPENAALAGLPAAYIVEQVTAIREGARRSSQPAMAAPALMAKVAMDATAADVAEAAAYFSSLTYKPWIRVVETDTVPRPELHGVSAYAAALDGSREPIGDRIVEVPEDRTRTDLRDDASGFVAYVPPGAIARGRVLATTTAGTRVPCGTCHGADLKGEVGPPLAGRSPSYIFRQLFDIQSGARSGPMVELMKVEVAGLTQAEMRDLAAYTASLAP